MICILCYNIFVLCCYDESHKSRCYAAMCHSTFWFADSFIDFVQSIIYIALLLLKGTPSPSSAKQNSFQVRIVLLLVEDNISKNRLLKVDEKGITLHC